MKIKPRYFPHPVASSFSDDVIDSSFEVDMTQEIEGENYIFTFQIDLKNEDLQKLIKRGIAKYMIHLESRKTWYRSAEKTDDEHVVLTVPANKLENEVEICSFVVAEEEIESYSNAQFHPDFSGETFHIYPGDILAIGPSVTPKIRKRSPRSVQSIIKANVNPDLKKGEVSIDVTGDFILVYLDTHTHSVYQNLKKYSVTPIFISILANPALIEALYHVRECLSDDSLSGEEVSELRDKLWYQSLSHRLSELGYQIDSENDLSDVTGLVSEILDFPVVDTFDLLEELIDNDKE